MRYKNTDAVPIKEERDLVEVTRCNLCQYTDGVVNDCGDVYCFLHKGWFDENGYCNYGKRREK